MTKYELKPHPSKAGNVNSMDVFWRKVILFPFNAAAALTTRRVPSATKRLTYIIPIIFIEHSSDSSCTVHTSSLYRALSLLRLFDIINSEISIWILKLKRVDQKASIDTRNRVDNGIPSSEWQKYAKIIPCQWEVRGWSEQQCGILKITIQWAWQ